MAFMHWVAAWQSGSRESLCCPAPLAVADSAPMSRGPYRGGEVSQRGASPGHTGGAPVFGLGRFVYTTDRAAKSYFVGEHSWYYIYEPHRLMETAEVPPQRTLILSFDGDK